MPSPRLSFRCYAIAVLRPCATPPHRGPLFRREADRRCALARHSFAASKPHHACAHRFPAVPMRCMSSLCNALPAQRSAVPMHYHSCAHQCLRLAAPRHASAYQHIFGLSRRMSLQCRCISLPVPVHALPSHIISRLYHAFAPPCVAVHGLAFASLLIAVLCRCIALPELRKTKPGRSFSMPRLLGAHPCRGHALLFLRVATQSQSSSQHCPSVPLLHLSTLCQSFG